MKTKKPWIILNNKGDRQVVLCHDPRQGNLSSQSHCSLMWLLRRWLQTDWSSHTSTAAFVGCSVLCLDWIKQCILGDDHLWCLFFLTVSCWIHIVVMYMKSFWKLDLWGPRNPTKAVKCRYLLVLTNKPHISHVYVFTLYIVARGSLLCSLFLEYVKSQALIAFEWGKNVLLCAYHSLF